MAIGSEVSGAGLGNITKYEGTDENKGDKERLHDVIDLRSESDFRESHYPYSTHFLGLSGPHGLLSRSYELPPPHLRNDVGIVIEKDIVYDKARQFLLKKGFKHVRKLPVQVRGLEKGMVSKRLWRASGLLESCIENIERDLGRVGTALDLGCGSGRDSAFLAGRGWSVCCCDRDEALLKNAKDLGRRYCDKGGSVQVLSMTLGSDIAEDRRMLEERQADLLVVVRFLRKSILPLLPAAVKPGGFVVYEHFLKGCENFGSPRKLSYMVERYELSSLFTKSSFTVVKDGVSVLPDGRPVIHFIAKKKSSAG